MNSLVFYLALALIIRAMYGPKAGSIAVVIALLIAFAVGFSRIYLGYHYLSDVVGGFAAGLRVAVGGGAGVREHPEDVGRPPVGTPSNASTDMNWLAFYRVQARLFWEWRATRLALIRRAVLSYIAAVIALLISPRSRTT